MKRKDGFVLQKVGDDTFAVAVTPAAAKVGSMVKLNPTAAYLFEYLSEERTEEGCVDAIVTRYGIDRAVAERDVHAFLTGLKEAGLLA